MFDARLASKPSTISSVEHWLRQIWNTKRKAKPLIILAGSHADEVVNQDATRVELSALHAHITSLFPIAATILYSKADVKSFEATLLDLCHSHASTKRMLSAKFPKAYGTLLTHIKSYREKHPNIKAIHWAQFLQWAEVCGIIGDDDAKSVLHLLHELGILLYYKASIIRDLVVLNPGWLSLAITQLQLMKENHFHGITQLDQLKDMLRLFKFEAEMLELLKFYELVFELPNNSFLLPFVLPRHARNAPVIPMLQYVRTYKFNFPVFGLCPSLLAFVHYLPNCRILELWATGAALSYNGQIAHISFTSGVSCSSVNFSVSGETNVRRGSSSLFNMLVTGLDMLLEKRHSRYLTEIDKVVHCTYPCCQDKIATESGATFKLSECEHILLQGKNTITCTSEGNHDISIPEIAPDISLFCDVLQLDHSEITQGDKIAEGGYGVLYKGTYKGEPVVIKELKSQDSQTAHEFMRESYLTFGLTHPCVIHLFGVALNPSAMILEYCKYGDLYNFIEKRRMEEDSSITFPFTIRWMIALDIALGLEYLHSLSPPIIHRDMRSPNILLAYLDNDKNHTRAKISDFGLSLPLLHPASGFLSTWDYLPPETLDAGIYTEKSDNYSFASVVQEMLTLRHPYEELEGDPKFGKVISEAGVKHWVRRDKSIIRAIVANTLRPRMPAALTELQRNLLEKCWKQSKDDRPTASQLVKTIRAIISINTIALDST